MAIARLSRPAVTPQAQVAQRFMRPAETPPRTTAFTGFRDAFETATRVRPQVNLSGAAQTGGANPTTGTTKQGGVWQNNADAVRVMQDTHLAEAQALGPFTGQGTNIAVVDSVWGPNLITEGLQRWTRNENFGADPGHFDLQISLAGDLAAPGANVTGRALINGNLDWMRWSSGHGPTMAERAESALSQAISDAGPNAVVAFVAPVGPLSQEDALALVEQMNEYAEQGGTVVIGSAVIDPQNWNDPVVRQAIEDSHIIVIDSPKSGPQETYPAGIEVSGESIPSGASSAVDISVPSPAGWNSVTVSQVAGVVALMKEANPALTGAEIEQILTSPATYSQQVPTTDGSMVPLFDAQEAVQAAMDYVPSGGGGGAGFD